MESLPNNLGPFRRHRKGKGTVVKTTRRLEVTVEREFLTVVAATHSGPSAPSPADAQPVLPSQTTSKDEVQK